MVSRRDVVRSAIALGAAAVMIGRPHIHGLAVNGADGVTEVIGILRRELEAAMTLVGAANAASLDKGILRVSEDRPT